MCGAVPPERAFDRSPRGHRARWEVLEGYDINDAGQSPALPDFVPLLGVMDDLVIVPLVLRWLLERLPAEVRQAARHR